MIADARAHIVKVRWQFAKTMPEWPHEYTVREWRPDLAEDFFEFAEPIRRDGVVESWPRDVATPRYHHACLEIEAESAGAHGCTGSRNHQP